MICSIVRISWGVLAIWVDLIFSFPYGKLIVALEQFEMYSSKPDTPREEFDEEKAMNILKKIAETERAYLNCFCEISESPTAVYYRNPALPDMYCHNFVQVKPNVEENKLKEIIQQEMTLREKNGDAFCRVATCDTIPQHLQTTKHGVCSTEHLGVYYYAPMSSPQWTMRTDCTIKPISNQSMVEDLVEKELVESGAAVGEDFCMRRSRVTGEVYCSEKPLNCYICYIDGRAVGSCELFIWNRTAKIESFGVLPEFQRQGIGRTLLKTLIDKALEAGANCIYLNADEDDTAKEMYANMGFVKLQDRYESLWKWESDC